MDVKYKNESFAFNVKGREVNLLPGGKIHELEESLDGLKREIREELGWENIDYSFLGVAEEFVTDKGFDNHSINLIYKGIYNGSIEKEFNGIEGDWATFKWIDIKDIDSYKIYPEFVKTVAKNPNKVFHTTDNLIKKNSTK